MAILKKRFSHNEKGNHDEAWFSLARDTETGEVFVLHEWAAKADVGSRRLPVVEFLAQQRSAVHDLLQLIGTLVVEPDHADRT